MRFHPSTPVPTFLFCILWLSSAVHAYIPAVPTNNTQDAIQSGLNVTDVSTLSLLWYQNGGSNSYSINVAYELVGAGSKGISQGALVHFGEHNLSNSTTITPWIALVSCDANATDASQMNDVFTLARDRGAVAGLLYSNYSSACIINKEYADPANFDQVFDIFSTQSLTSARLIEERFLNINQTLYGDYDPQQLNASFYAINSTINNGTTSLPGYIFATLHAYNATDTTVPPSSTANGPNGNNNQQQGKKTSLAMIILYVITGCVSALFIVVIVSGAIRAFRHPERYGPRRVDPANPDEVMYPQSRAKGLARAVLDTFPIVKFNLAEDEQRQKDEEARGMELSHWEVVDQPKTSDGSGGSEQKVTSEKPLPMEEGSSNGQLRRGTLRRTGTQSSRQNTDVTPQTIGRETCPICIVDFEEGDDLRVLPCEGKHRFHQACVDPWLLELSSSCPLCREDFYALESMLSGRSEDQHGPYGYDHEYEDPPPTASSRGRFSRYLRFATRRRGSTIHEHSGYYDQNYPPVPALPHQEERN
ncbi:hypothetical protein BJ322DRAFT_1007070 [Thelephora terrestris]|uniref:RING-type domain-containing protein n=1 Tax=Thelephora terrestris TaxID=56493 RepID=A0A9P6L6C8_9AGAM|nr:hypothetical protein BJ322DRAFT_1007070 [Thelephora terrestris]